MAELGTTQAFYAVSQSPRGPKTFLAHEAPEHLVVAAAVAGD